MTVHDIRSVSTETPYLKRLFYTPVMTRALRGADHIITVSHAMKAQILEIAPEARITPIYNGIDPKRWEMAPGAAASARDALGIPPEFLLSVGHLESRKNYVRLVEAVAALRAAGRALPLVIVGNDAGEGPAVAAEIRRLRLEGEVRILSGLDDETLTALYAEASLVVFPSRYEGFGIPVLEAMAAGCPLLLSDIAVFRGMTAMPWRPASPSSWPMARGGRNSSPTVGEGSQTSPFPSWPSRWPGSIGPSYDGRCAQRRSRAILRPGSDPVTTSS